MAKKICFKCSRSFKNKRALNTHDWRAHPYLAPIIPKSEHKNFIDLVKNSINSWGVDLTDEQSKHPSIDKLQLGALFTIVSELREIKNELKRNKTIC